jgi:hypothetical protein
MRDNLDIVFALILFLHFFLNFRKTEFAAATLICCPIILLHNEKKISFLEVSTASEGDLYLLINEDITLSLLDKYFFAVFQYFGFLLMSISRWYLFVCGKFPF